MLPGGDTLVIEVNLEAHKKRYTKEQGQIDIEDRLYKHLLCIELEDLEESKHKNKGVHEEYAEDNDDDPGHNFEDEKGRELICCNLLFGECLVVRVLRPHCSILIIPNESGM